MDYTLAPALLADIRGMIEEVRGAVAAAVNAGLTLLYWRIGKRINEEVLLGERAAYGKEIVATLAQELTRAYDGGFAEKNLRRMMQFAEVFPDEQIVVSLIRQLMLYERIALSRKPDELIRITSTGGLAFASPPVRCRADLDEVIYRGRYVFSRARTCSMM
jgi:hypothetical protein